MAYKFYSGLEIERHSEDSEGHAQEKGRKVYWTRTDGCAFGMKYEEVAVMKRWTILTSSRQLYLYLSRRCSGDHEHRECRGPVAQFSSYYPRDGEGCEEGYDLPVEIGQAWRKPS